MLQGKQATLENDVYELKKKLQVELEVKLSPTFHPRNSFLLPSPSVLIPVTNESCPVVQNEKTLAKAVEKSRSEKKKLQDELAQSQAELSRLRNRLSEMEAQLQSTRQE